MTIAADERRWNSPTTLYIARSLAARSDDRPLAVLDLGCGDGTVLAHLAGYGHDLFGCDLPERRPALEKKLAPVFGTSFSRRIRTVTDEESVPFEDGFFDIVYANQVFEHVRDLEGVLQECHRVLKSRGTLLTTFPPATCPLEVHLGVPLAHWLPSGKVRTAYLQLCYEIGLRPRLEGRTARETAGEQDRYLREKTFYRTVGRTVALASAYFGAVHCETDQLIAAKLDMLSAADRPSLKVAAGIGRGLNGTITRFLVSRLLVAAYAFSNPASAPDPREPLPCPA